MLGRTSRCSPARPWFLHSRYLISSEYYSPSFRYINAYFILSLLPAGIIHFIYFINLHASLYHYNSPYYLPHYPILYPASPKLPLFPAEPSKFPSFLPHYHSHSLSSQFHRPINQTQPPFQTIFLPVKPFKTPRYNNWCLVQPGNPTLIRHPLRITEFWALISALFLSWYALWSWFLNLHNLIKIFLDLWGLFGVNLDTPSYLLAAGVAAIINSINRQSSMCALIS